MGGVNTSTRQHVNTSTHSAIGFLTISTNMSSAMKSRDAFLFAVLFAVAGASNCELRFDTAMSADFYKNVRVSQSACCILCTKDSRCRTAVYSPQGECHLHDATDSAHPFADRGWTLMIKKTQTIVDLAVATPDLSTLVAALKAGGLVDTLSSKGPFTVFAPTNEAFAALPAGTLANLLKPENKAQLVDLLTYHVVSGDVHAKDITDMEMIKTVEGKNVTARVTSGGILINSAKVVTADVDASNGVIHIIDAVPMPGNPPKPASKTIVDIAVANADLSTLVTALKAGGLVKTLEGKGPFTVFAPTNEAFGKLPNATLAHLLDPANVKELDAVLTYHVVAGVAAFSKDLTDGEKIKTVEGQSVVAHVSAAGVMINGATVQTADIAASNGVIHITDKVLSLPPAPAPVPTKTIVDLAVATADLSTLVAALKAGGLVETLSGKGPFTVFAPTNEAFGKLPKATLAHLLEPANKKELDAILTYHVVAGVAAFSKDLTDGEHIKTVEGQSVVAHVSAAGVKINDATVKTADVAASNGVIHIIDSVLIPPTAGKTIVDLAVATPDLATLVAALKAGGLVETLSG